MKSPRIKKKVIPNILSQPPDDLKITFSLSSASEAISKYILERIISLTVFQSHLKKIESQISFKCFDYTKKFLNTYIKSQFISYDHDETKRNDKTDCLPNFSIEKIKSSKDDSNNTHPTINLQFDAMGPFFNNSSHCDNTWSFPSEPPCIKVDRYASTLISYQPLPTPKELNDKQINIMKDKKCNALDDLIDNDVNKNRFIHRKSSIISFGKINFNDNQIVQKKRRTMVDIMNEMSVHDIPNENNVNDIEKEIEYKELRKEKEEQIKKVEREKKVIEQKEKETQMQINKEQQKQKELLKRNKNFTIDSKGKIVIIKKVDLNLLADEFITIKSQSKNIVQKKGSSSKDIQINGVIAVNPNLSPKKTNNKGTTIPNEQTNNNLPKIHSKHNKLKKNKKNLHSIPQGAVKDKAKENEKKIDREPVIPSGSCFEKITLEVGVKITENSKIKSGGKDFSKKYKKYSLESYNKKLKETLSSTNFFPKPNQDLNFSQQNIFESIGNNISDGSQTMTNIFQKRILSYTSNKPFLSKMNKTNYTSLIKVNSENQLSLPRAIENLDLLQENEGEETQRKGKNIFKAQNCQNNTIVNHNYSKSKIELDEMNKFTTTIMQMEKWGEKGKLSKMGPKILRLPKKPQLNDIRINGQKMLRERMFRSHSSNKFVLSPELMNKEKNFFFN